MEVLSGRVVLKYSTVVVPHGSGIYIKVISRPVQTEWRLIPSDATN
jgi:hypothetical protein